MHNYLKKVLSLLTVLIVLIGSILLPVNAQGAETNISTTKAPKSYLQTTTVKGLKKGDQVYLVPLVQGLYGKESNKFMYYESAVIAKNNGVNIENKDINFIIPPEKLGKIYSDYMSEHADNFDKPSESGSIYLAAANDEGTAQNSVVGPGLYMVLIKPQKVDTQYNPALLGVNLSDDEAAELDMKTKFEYGDETYMKATELGIVKNIKIDEDTLVKKSSVFADDNIKFVINGITIPYYSDSYEMDKVEFHIKDRFINNAYSLAEGPSKSIKVKDGKTKIAFDGIKKVNNLDDEDEFNQILEANKDSGLLILYNENQGFDIFFQRSKLKTYAGHEISIEYDAKVNISGNHVSFKDYSVNENKATIIATGDPNSVIEKSDSVYTYLFKIPLWKYDADETNSRFTNTQTMIDTYWGYALNGAKFAVYKDPDCKTQIKQNEDDGYLTTAKLNEKISGIGNIKGVSGNIVDRQELELINKKIDEKKGILPDDRTIGNGIFYVREVEAPTKGEEKFKVNPTLYKVMIDFAVNSRNDSQLDYHNVRIFNMSNKQLVDGFKGNTSPQANVFYFSVPNSKKPFLPSTGSDTMLLFTFVGVGLITLTVFVARKKKHQSIAN